jgi:hypothetical protein
MSVIIQEPELSEDAVEHPVHTAESDHGARIVALDSLGPEYKDLVSWVRSMRHGRDKALVLDHGDAVRLRWYTDTQNLSLYVVPPSTAKPDGYMGGSVQHRAPYPGETWTRGADLADGPYAFETWCQFLADALGSTSLGLAPSIRQHLGDPE